jgi:cation:H+ antiporter
MLTLLLFVVGFVLLVKGADLLVDGSSSIAKRLGISDLVIGLTIVAFGTSTPELLVNLNIVGSNIANILLILGVSALIYPLEIKKSTNWKEIPMNLLAVAVLFFLANDILIDKAPASFLSRIDGLVLLGFFLIFLVYTVGLAKAEHESEDEVKKKSTPVALLMVVGGLIGLAIGGKWVVDGAIAMAKFWGVSESLIGLTVVAIGTSLPELATSAVAAFKRKTDIAIGNVVGSNLFNIFWILGASSIVRPLPINASTNIDLAVCFGATLLLFIFCFTPKRGHLARHEGAIFLVCYIAYVAYLIMKG